MAINELRSITTFVKAAELGSLRKAAVAQGVTPQAASQALTQLEQHLGVRLFHRTTRSMSLTEEGQRFLEAVQPAMLNLQQALQTVKLSKEEIAGPLRIIGPRSTFRPILWPVLEEFTQRYPDIQPDVQLDDRVVNWVEGRVDVGFRMGTSPQEGLIARRLFPLQMIICAAPEYLQQHGVPQGLHDLGRHRCSAYRHPSTGRVMPWHVGEGDTVVDYPVAAAICTNDEELELQAVLSGKVIGQLSCVTAAPHIRAGRLVPILTKHAANYASFFIYYGSRTAQPARVRAFIDLAVERLVDSTDYVFSEKELAAAERGWSKTGRSQP